MKILNWLKSVLHIIKNVRIGALIYKIPFSTLIAIALFCVLIENGWFPGLNDQPIHIAYTQFWHLYHVFTLYVFFFAFVCYIVGGLFAYEPNK